VSYACLLVHMHPSFVDSPLHISNNIHERLRDFEKLLLGKAYWWIGNAHEWIKIHITSVGRVCSTGVYKRSCIWESKICMRVWVGGKGRYRALPLLVITAIRLLSESMD